MIPETTHLQFLVLTMLLEGERSGRKLRAALAKNGVQKSGPAFYQLMSRLEDDGVVNGWYDQKVIEDQAIKERHYELTDDGRDAWREVWNFYDSLASHCESLGVVPMIAKKMT